MIVIWNILQIKERSCSEQPTDVEIDVDPMNLAVASSRLWIKDSLVKSFVFSLYPSLNKSSSSGGILYSRKYGYVVRSLRHA